ncbi:MAG TPA: hypothetical protein VLJ18_11160 [Thermoanaerobaculia bacterium]|nr:hypothetical protein [Thermoanaerobaculia bacterium]
MTRGLLLAVLLATDPSPSPAPTPTAPPTPTPTPEKRDPRLVAALESRQGIGMERVALFDDGTLVRVRGYRAQQIVDRKSISPQEIAVVRRVCLEALTVRAKDVEDPARSALGDAQARRITLEITDPGGGSRIYTYDDLTSLPLAVGRARGALEDLRSRFEKQDLAETKWDTKALKSGAFLRRRADGVWYRVVHDDTLDHDFELEELDSSGEQGSHKLRIFVYRGDIPRLFMDPAAAGPGPPAPSPATRR